ncbi:TetR/AcrR family transcriptional regulator [Roseixanthobacter glucoisosaccharinicivorans]|uniref:TetR/AcrR family transcriptional regulator n=1 Tax=Roseixanthobacter glucoisosaccharinicivorans TaxID=3119923 RepID=UPI00372743CB
MSDPLPAVPRVPAPVSSPEGKAAEGTPTGGLRARKRRETLARIAEAGLRLFVAQGFEATTLDAIADAAGISRRTFFHYFDSKEAILLAWEAGVDDLFLAAFAAQPEAETPLETVRLALEAVIARYESDQAIAIDRLLRSTEALRARKQGKYERQERTLHAALMARWPDPARAGALRMVAMVSIGALRLAAEAWSASGGQRPMVDHLREAFAQMRSELSA